LLDLKQFIPLSLFLIELLRSLFFKNEVHSLVYSLFLLYHKLNLMA